MSQTRIFTEDDFVGLYKFLDSKDCVGPTLAGCEVVADPDVDIQAYLQGIDICLFDSGCLNYHQVLTYKNKLKGGEDAWTTNG